MWREVASGGEVTALDKLIEEAEGIAETAEDHGENFMPQVVRSLVAIVKRLRANGYAHNTKCEECHTNLSVRRLVDKDCEAIASGEKGDGDAS